MLLSCERENASHRPSLRDAGSAASRTWPVADRFVLLRGHGPFRGFGMHRPARTVSRDLDDAADRMQRKAVIPGRLDFRAEHREAVWPESIGVSGCEMEHGVSGRPELRGEPGQRVRRPGAEGEDDRCGFDALALRGDDSVDAAGKISRGGMSLKQ